MASHSEYQPLHDRASVIYCHASARLCTGDILPMCRLEQVWPAW